MSCRSWAAGVGQACRADVEAVDCEPALDLLLVGAAAAVRRVAEPAADHVAFFACRAGLMALLRPFVQLAVVAVVADGALVPAGLRFQI